MRREILAGTKRRGGSMNPRRGMACRVSPALVVVMIAALVGVFQVDGFGEGDRSGVVEERGGQETGKPFWRDVVDVVSAFAVIVIGVATVWVMIAQTRQTKRQGRWEKQFGERQDRWQREFAERQERMRQGERKHEVVKGVVRFYEKLAKGEKIKWWDVQELLVVNIGRGLAMFKGAKRKWLVELADKAKKWWEVEKLVEEEGETEESERRRKELREWFQRSGEAIGELVEACWEK